MLVNENKAGYSFQSIEKTKMAAFPLHKENSNETNLIYHYVIVVIVKQIKIENIGKNSFLV
jgi:hypothetical protein